MLHSKRWSAQSGYWHVPLPKSGKRPCAPHLLVERYFTVWSIFLNPWKLVCSDCNEITGSIKNWVDNLHYHRCFCVQRYCICTSRWSKGGSNQAAHSCESVDKFTIFLLHILSRCLYSSDRTVSFIPSSRCRRSAGSVATF